MRVTIMMRMIFPFLFTTRLLLEHDLPVNGDQTFCRRKHRGVNPSSNPCIPDGYPTHEGDDDPGWHGCPDNAGPIGPSNDRSTHVIRKVEVTSRISRIVSEHIDPCLPLPHIAGVTLCTEGRGKCCKISRLVEH